MASLTALVTGATGAVGPEVVRALQAAGYNVRTLSRATPAANVLPSGVDVRLGDVCDEHSVRSAIAGTNLVVHLAGLLHQFSTSADLVDKHRRINIGGTETVVRAAEVAGVERVVFLSTIAVYGPSRGRVIDETVTPDPDTEYAKSKLAAEDVVRRAMIGGRPVGTILRSAAVYGDRVKGNYRRLAKAIGRRRFVRIGPGHNRRTIVHQRDLASAVVIASQHPAAAGGVFNVSDGRVHTLAEIVDAIYRALGRRPPPFYVPLALAEAGVSGIEGICRMTGIRPPVTKALFQKYSEDTAVDAAKIQRDLGFTPAVDLESGWRETMPALLTQ